MHICSCIWPSRASHFTCTWLSIAKTTCQPCQNSMKQDQHKSAEDILVLLRYGTSSAEALQLVAKMPGVCGSSMLLTNRKAIGACGLSGHRPNSLLHLQVSGGWCAFCVGRDDFVLEQQAAVAGIFHDCCGKLCIPECDTWICMCSICEAGWKITGATARALLAEQFARRLHHEMHSKFINGSCQQRAC